jgi:hypothetical protein
MGRIKVADLERISAEVEDLRPAQHHERFPPDVDTVGALLLEGDLPLIVDPTSEPLSLK